MKQLHIRPLAICVCRDGNRILVADGQDALGGVEGSSPFKAVWRTLACLRETGARLYPEGLWELLAQRVGPCAG